LNESVDEVYSPKSMNSRRFNSPQNKGKEDMKNLMQYSFSLPFRPEVRE